MADNARIGGAYVELQADTTQFRAELNNAKNATQTAAAESSRSFDRMSTSGQTAYGRLRQSIQSVTRVIGTASIAAAAITTIAAAIEGLEERFRSGADRAKGFVDSIEFDSASSSIAEIDKRLQELNERLETATRTDLEGRLRQGANVLSGYTQQQLEDEIAKLNAARASLQVQISALRIRQKEREEAEKIRKEYEKLRALQRADQSGFGMSNILVSNLQLNKSNMYNRSVRNGQWRGGRSR